MWEHWFSSCCIFYFCSCRHGIIIVISLVFICNIITSTVLFSARVWFCKITLYHTCTSCSRIDLRSWTRILFLHGRLVETWNKYLQWRRSRERNTICLNLGIRGRKSPGNLGVSLCVFLYFSSLLCPLSLPMLRSDFRSQFHSQPYFYLSNLFYIPPYTHFTPLMSFLCLSFHMSVYISIFPGHPKCDHIAHFSTLFGSVIRDHLQKTSQVRTVFFIVSCNQVHSRSILG